MSVNLETTRDSSAWESLAKQEGVERAVKALMENGFKAEQVADGKAALARIQSIIPEGARVMTGGSRTLEEIGLTKLLASGTHQWVNLKSRMLSEPDPAKQTELRRQAVYADYFVGSVQAVTEAGQLVAGSATGSQLAGYAYGGNNLIIVAGTQKVTRDLDEALRRLREHSTPLEDKRMKGLGAPGTLLSKILIYEKERRRNVHVILVNEKLGF